MYIDDVETLKEMHESVLKAIEDYFVYLEKQGVSSRDSYITHWLEKGFFYNRYESNIHYFLEHHLSSR